jgi:hypothetical protein
MKRLWFELRRARSEQPLAEERSLLPTARRALMPPAPRTQCNAI